MGELIIVGQERLKLHPKNIRIYYAPREVEEMARSLAAMGQIQETGNIEALLAIEIPETPGDYYVVAGNLRLTAGRSLGEQCPPFKCEVIGASQAEQLLIMAAGEIHFPKDTISQGRHYRRLIEEEGYSQASIAEYTGLSVTTIGKCLAALELDEEIQQLFVEKRLPSDIRIIRALRDIPDKAQRVQIARYYAGRDVAIGRIVQRVRQLALKVQHVNGNGPGYVEARARAEAKAEEMRAARVEKRRQGRGGLDAESAERIRQAAERILCEGCSLLALTDKCALCPGPMEFLAHLGEMVEAALPAAEDAPEENQDWHARVKSVEDVREMMREYAA